MDITARQDREYENLSRDAEEMRERFFNGMSRYNSGKTFKNVGEMDPIIAGLPKAEYRTLHLSDKKVEKSEVKEDGKIEQPLTTIDQHGIDQRYAVFNKDRNRVSAVVSSKYDLHQHEEVFKPLSEAVKGMETNVFGSVRSFNNGDGFDLVALTDESFKVEGDSDYFVGFKLKNSYDKSSGIKMNCFMVRGVCCNGMIWSKGEMFEPLSRVHVGEIDMVEQYQEYIQKIMDNVPEIKARIEKAHEESFKITVVQEKVLENMGIPPTKVEEIMEMPTLKHNKQPTRMDIYNAVTRFITHEGTDLSHRSEEVYQSRAEKALTEDREKLTVEVEE